MTNYPPANFLLNSELRYRYEERVGILTQSDVAPSPEQSEIAQREAMAAIEEIINL